MLGPRSSEENADSSVSINFTESWRYLLISPKFARTRAENGTDGIEGRIVNRKASIAGQGAPPAAPEIWAERFDPGERQHDLFVFFAAAESEP